MTDTIAAAIDRPGVYDLPADVYLADPVAGGSLSSTGARKMLPPSCPAKFKYWRDHGQPPKADFDFGHAAHLHVLGVGPPLVVVDAADWRTKAAKEQRAAAYEAGHVPLLVADYDTVVAMSVALLDHPVASALFHPRGGKAEQTLIWRDGQTGVWRRALLDWLKHRPEGGGRIVVPDYKTCKSAATDDLQRAIHAYGYHMQGATYLDGVRALDLDGNPAFVIVAQEKEPPFLVNVVEPDAVALRIGAQRNREALEIYAECVAADRWPGYSDEVELVSLPAWAERLYTNGDIW
jgi:hypothetical protein